LTDKSIAIQKTVTDLTHPGAPVPGDTLQYTIQGEVSDYFALQSLVVDDTAHDGQTLTGTPTLAVSQHTGSSASAAFNGANFTFPAKAANGDTDAEFRLSNELVTRGQSGQLVGGCIP